MKVILIGEEHIASNGPYFLLETLKMLKEQKINCSLALEIPSMENLNTLYMINNINNPYLLLTQLQRQSFISESITLFPAFSADLANQESMDIRDEIMASEIIEHTADADVVVMLVGALHLEGISHHLKENDIDVICCAPKCLVFGSYPDELRELVVNKHGFFYSAEKNNTQLFKQQIKKLIKPDQTSELVCHTPA